MSEDNWTVQASYKHGAQHQHLLNVRGADAQDLKRHLDDLTVTDTAEAVVSFGGLLGALDTTVNTLKPADVPQTPLQRMQQAAAAPVDSQPAYDPPPLQQPAASSAPMCPHGTRKFVSKVGAKGPWKAWMCPSDRDDPTKCEPQWIK